MIEIGFAGAVSVKQLQRLICIDIFLGGIFMNYG